jgi:hypothetical protein
MTEHREKFDDAEQRRQICELLASNPKFARAMRELKRRWQDMNRLPPNWQVRPDGDNWMVIDERAPKTEENYYGVVGYGFATHQEAMQFVVQGQLAWLTRHTDGNG